MAQSGNGIICIKEDFVGEDDPVALTAVPRRLGPFRVVGQGIAETDSGVPLLQSDGLGGVARLTATNEADHTCGLETAIMFEVARNGTIIAEARVRFADLDEKEAFFGFTDIDIASQVPSIQTDLVHGGTATITLTASDLVGFLLSSELTDDEDWHAVYNGGTTTGATDSTALDLDDDAVAGEFQILRLEIAPNGTVKWFIDGVLKKTVAGAVSTTVDLKFFIAVETKATTIASMDVDYIEIVANRGDDDWPE